MGSGIKLNNNTEVWIILKWVPHWCVFFYRLVCLNHVRIIRISLCCICLYGFIYHVSNLTDHLWLPFLPSLFKSHFHFQSLFRLIFAEIKHLEWLLTSKCNLVDQIPLPLSELCHSVCSTVWKGENELNALKAIYMVMA